jgi:hypothetical protein
VRVVGDIVVFLVSVTVAVSYSSVCELSHLQDALNLLHVVAGTWMDYEVE